MGNSIRNCFRPNSTETIPLLVLGLRSSGKTDVVHRIMAKRREEYLETNGCRVFPSFKVLKKDIKLIELGGDQFIDIWKYYFLDAMGIIFVIDSSDTFMIDRSKQVFSTIFTNELLTGKPFLLLANKKDIKNSVDYLDICDYFNVENMANFYRTPCLIEECGHFESDQKILRKSIEWLVKTIHINYKTIHNKIRFLRLLTTNEGSVIEEFANRKPKRALTGKRKKQIRFSSDFRRPKSAPMKMKFSFKRNNNYLRKGNKGSSPKLTQKSSKSARRFNKVGPSECAGEIATSQNHFSTSIEEPDPDFAMPPLSPFKGRIWDESKVANGTAKIINNEPRPDSKSQKSRATDNDNDIIIEDLSLSAATD